MAAINPKRIYGNWLSGFALDVHSLSSVYLGVNEAGHDVFDTTRSEMGELLYRLKYCGDKSAALEIIDTASAVLKPHRSKFDILVPVPPSGARAIQPVIIVARGIGKAIGLPVVKCISLTRRATQLKYAGVALAFAREREVYGNDSYEILRQSEGDLDAFAARYRMRGLLHALWGELLYRGLRNSGLARAYLRRAILSGVINPKTLCLFGWSLMGLAWPGSSPLQDTSHG